MPGRPVALNGLSYFDLPPIFRCGVELAEATAALNPSEWADLPLDIEGLASPHLSRWMERHRRLRRIEEEAERLKRSLGATGPLAWVDDEKTGGPKWESYDQRFNNFDHDRVVRQALVKLSTAAIDLSGFVTWRELQWPMRDRGLRLLAWGLAQLWEGLSVDERSCVRDRLPRIQRAVGWPANSAADPAPYDGPGDIPVADQSRIISGYVSCGRGYLNDWQQAERMRVDDGQERFLREATPEQFAEVAEQATQAIQAMAKCDPGTAGEWGTHYKKAFWPLACLQRAQEIPPHEAWPPVTLCQRKVLADAAATLYVTVGGTPEAKSQIKPADAERALGRFFEAIGHLRSAIDTPEKRDDAGIVVVDVGPTVAEPGTQDFLGLLRVFTNGVSDERIKKAHALLSAAHLNANDKLTKIDTLMRIPATASAEQLGEVLGVTKQAVLKTEWWIQNRKGRRQTKSGGGTNN